MFGIDDIIGASAAAVGASGMSGLFSARQASLDKGWQEMMRSTAVQSQVADMQSAGINPVMAARLGGNATPGAPNMASMPPPDPASAMLRIASAKEASAKAQSAQVQANIDTDNYNKSKSAPFLQTLPPQISGPAKAVADTLKEGADKVIDFLDPGGKAVEDMLKGGVRGKLPSSAVEAGRASGVGVLPGGGVVKRAVPGQLNILNLKRRAR